MRVTMIKKFNIIISLWLILIFATLCLLGFQLGINGFYIAALVVGSLLVASNLINLISGIISSRPKSIQTKKEYN